LSFFFKKKPSYVWHDVILVTIALRKGQTVVSEELREKHVNRTGENVELALLGTDCQNSPSDGLS
jgi:hypothetical protein